MGAHFGSLLALLIYFRKDLARMGAGWVNSFSAGRNRDADMVWFLVIATIPICLAGLLFHDMAGHLRDPLIIAGATILFALLLWWADRYGRRQRDVDDFRIRDAVVIGLFQVLAIIPGTSRSGITITAGLMLGLKREDASRFAFLLAIPVILLASGYELLNVTCLRNTGGLVCPVHGHCRLVHQRLADDSLVPQTGGTHRNAALRHLPAVPGRCVIRPVHIAHSLRKTSSTGTCIPLASPLFCCARAMTASSSPYCASLMPLPKAALVWECTQYSQALATETAI